MTEVKYTQWNLYKGNTGSIKLDIIRDLALCLRAADPGDCGTGCPEDEYVGEAVVLVNKLRSIINQDYRDQQNRIVVLLYSHFYDQFGGFVGKPDHEIWQNLAKSCVEIMTRSRCSRQS